MMDLRPIEIQTEWMPEGAYLLWAEPKIDWNELKKLLFGYHAPSYYGTFIEQREHGPNSGLILPAHWALLYWENPQSLKLPLLQWSEDIAIIRSFAPLLREALMNRWFVPDYRKWKSGAFGWKLWLPAEKQLEFDRLSHGNKRFAFIEEWFDLAVTEIVKENLDGAPSLFDAHAVPAIDRCVEIVLQYRESDPADFFDEDEWLNSIGWTADSPPFRIALQLVEPTAQNGWRLQTIFQDKALPDNMIPCSLRGVPYDGQLPIDWKPYAHERLKRERRKWLQMLGELRDKDHPDHLPEHLTEEQAWIFLSEGSRRLVEAGVTVFLPAWWERAGRARSVLKTKTKATAGAAGTAMLGLEQILQFDWKVAIGGIELSEQEFQTILAEKRRLLHIRGQWIQLNPEMLQLIQKKLKQLQKRGGLTLREILESTLTASGRKESVPGPEEDDIPFVQMEVELHGHIERLIRQLNHQSKPPAVKTPDGLHGTLRSYQLEGLSWLVFLRKLGMGACLADDMGLGKTIQWIAALLYVKQNGLANGPSLLICPTSVLGNWQKEFQRFAPSLNVYLHHGANRNKGKSFQDLASQADVVLTTYTLGHLDHDELAGVQWDSLCLDEAQNIKNPHTKQSAAIRKLTAHHRVALTGTPMENRLSELWSIFDFINPGCLGSLRAFSRRYANAIEQTKNAEDIRQLQQLIRPFLLRRVKNDPAIELDLPDKNEMKSYVALTVEQGTLYEQQLQGLFDRIERLSGMERRGAVLTAIMKLKQICNHPALLLKDYGRPASQLQQQSNKAVRLLEMIHEVREKGEKCLVFTQFVEMGTLLQTIVRQQMKEEVLFMHGGISRANRDEMIARFQDQDPQRSADHPVGVLILSLKTGGIGLNLTAANHVFHFDRWWNPAVENQASDRVYRIGQTRDVQVHKFVTLGTLEEKIDEMLEQKQGLSEQIVGSGEQWITEYSTDELRELLSLRKEWLTVG